MPNSPVPIPFYSTNLRCTRQVQFPLLTKRDQSSKQSLHAHIQQLFIALKPLRDKEGKDTGFFQLQEVFQAFGTH